MKEIIINQPHLQSLQQRLGSVFLSAMSWLLWLYFLLPLFTLGGWLMGVKSWSDEIRWFGGYKTLLELLQMYGGIIIVIALLWLVWTFFLSWLHASTKHKTLAPVSDRALANLFELETAQLLNAKACKTLTVHFDDHAAITRIDCIK
ncbi:poly-beta-1,6-N-acetyl-D-glucosamine biosynthesis protein PgaD [Methylomonas sp. LL1]|uniref:poly-beta-1,6-N-acetyl-D-glucosamine biosynthesis protein PgaD n=1 Tax=Methylomonas sp. LL1 TaxID=2785785 RepID=UPI0018C3A52F|nr:poly-beta-1,6-N-acetyl-D-glucosamine biosynthesis protein PgaD [Methylomonas sp. LL1]QPK65414.1 poly-beta-1,6-N-acetyl-D-glucosamine biosynthesis protein PgaD [Methylomonas sp. LL1]